PVARWVGLALRGPFEPDELRLTRGRTQPAEGAPQLAGWFVPPDEFDRKSVSKPDLRQEVRTDRHWRQTCVLEHCIDDRWVPAALEGARSDWRVRPGPRRPVVA
ncbi:MAG TPA: hypothetical protein VEA79_03660, partial [Phenylobacterium sp.]|nr:hypothetical protein [Phenylobacterium sp.]